MSKLGHLLWLCWVRLTLTRCRYSLQHGIALRHLTDSKRGCIGQVMKVRLCVCYLHHTKAVWRQSHHVTDLVKNNRAWTDHGDYKRVKLLMAGHYGSEEISASSQNALDLLLLSVTCWYGPPRSHRWSVYLRSVQPSGTLSAWCSAHICLSVNLPFLSCGLTSMIYVSYNHRLCNSQLQCT